MKPTWQELDLMTAAVQYARKRISVHGVKADVLAAMKQAEQFLEHCAWEVRKFERSEEKS